MVGESRCYLKGLAMRENIEIPTNATIITNDQEKMEEQKQSQLAPE